MITSHLDNPKTPLTNFDLIFDKPADFHTMIIQWMRAIALSQYGSEDMRLELVDQLGQLAESIIHWKNQQG